MKVKQFKKHKEEFNQLISEYKWQKALEIVNKMIISIASLYYKRSLVEKKLQDNKAALESINKALEIDAKYQEADVHFHKIVAKIKRDSK